MQTLPLFLELEEFRAVHACWSDASIQTVSEVLLDGRLSEDAIQWSADTHHSLHRAIETLTKGPEEPLPEGCWFTDTSGHERNEVRLAWWKENARTWKDIAISVPDAENQLPNANLPPSISAETYLASSEPVFFGHYWMQGEVVMQAPNALCLDYSARLDGPLVSYQMEPGSGLLSLKNLTVCKLD